MSAFRYVRAGDLEHAVRALGDPGAVAVSGGTDLLVAIREGMVTPVTLVDLRRLPGATTIEFREDGGFRIGGAVTLSRLAADPAVRTRCPVLAESCAVSASPALRNMGTIAGNLCQRPRCWYLRSGVACHKSGGTTCPAVEGENQHHAILGAGPCCMVHPSDPAVALTALDATVHTAGPDGERAITLAGFFANAARQADRETSLRPGEVITHVEVSSRATGGRQRYVKVTQRNTWDFALASVAAARHGDGSVRLVLGGVAPAPWRVPESVEEDIASGGLADDDHDVLAARALHDVRPLARNGYKVVLATTLLRDAIAYLAGRA